jgi:hypothetical protein
MSSCDFSATIEGRLYTGRYTVIRENITVSCEFGEKTIQLGHTYSKIMARMILGEIVRDELRRKGLLPNQTIAPAPIPPTLHPQLSSR